MGRACRIPLLVGLVNLCAPIFTTFVQPRFNFQTVLRLGPRQAGFDDALDRFPQRGGVMASDLESPVREWPGRRGRRKGGYQRYREEQDQRLWNDQRNQRNQRDQRDQRDQRSVRSPRSRFEDDLTPEEREQRFRFQIQSPVTLTTFIKRSETQEQLMWTITTAMDEGMLNHIHIAATFNRLASLKKKAPLTAKILRSPTLVLLARQAARVADRREFRARELASMLMSCAALRTDLPWLAEELGTSLAKWVATYAKEMNPHALANTVYGLGVLNLGDSPEVTSAIESCTKQIPMQLGRFSSMDVAQVSWGIGARDRHDGASDLMASLAQWVTVEAATLPDAAAFTDLPMIALSFVRLQNWQPKMMEAIANRLVNHLAEIRLWSLSALLWSWKSSSFEPDDAYSTRFLETLMCAAKARRIRQEDIDRAPEGPKGETRNSWSSGTYRGLRVIEKF
ncbi:unnamed protein product [Durusdinium trenchii]|uniref:Uncharacterized protein n=2 Tax=Durusdinium trenchii TaxID=1381693 RepID=A0ABP0K307_9DINO